MSFLPAAVHQHFIMHDPVLAAWIEQIAPFELEEGVASDRYFAALGESIVSQQLSVKVSDVIWARVLKLFPDQQFEPFLLLQLTEVDLRAVGLSFAKIKYLKDLAKKVLSGEVKLVGLNELANEEIVAELTKVKGIGQWTAEMFLMFSLARPDVFSTGDLGLKKGIQKVYGLAELPKLEELPKFTAVWTPYRTYASRILWRVLDLK